MALRRADAPGATDAFAELVERADADGSAAAPGDDGDDDRGDGAPASGDAESISEAAYAAGDADVAFERVGSLLLGDPDPALAADVAGRLETRFPERAGAALVVARLALARGEEAPARAALERALELDPSDTGTLLLSTRLAAAGGDVDGALARLGAAVEASPDDRRLRLGHAQLLAEAGRLDAARDALAELDERLDAAASAPDAPDPEVPGPDGLREADIRLSMAELALQAGLSRRAETWFGELAGEGPHTDQARFQLARLRDAANDPATAVGLYEAVGPSEWFVTAQVRAAELRAAQGDVELARARLQELGDGVVDPEVRPRLVTAEGRILQEAGELETAVEVLGEGLERFPDSGELRYARALAADAAGRPEVLESDLAALIESEPDNAHALNALGYHLADEDARLDEAEGYLERAMALREGDPAIMDSLGWLRFRQGRADEAIELLERAYALLPDPEIAAHLGEALWTTGRRDEARTVWDEALAASPGDALIEATMERLVD